MANEERVYSDEGFLSKLGEPVAGSSRGKATLIVTRNTEKKSVSYIVEIAPKSKPAIDPLPLEGVSNFGYDEAFKFFKYTEHHLHELALSANRKASWKNIRARAQGLGHRIAELAGLEPLLNMLNRELERGDVLYIRTDEAWIPWEIVYDSRRRIFLGEQYVIARQRNTSNHLPVHERVPKYSEQVKLIVNAVGNNTRCASQALNLFSEALYQGKVESHNPIHRRYFCVADLMKLIENKADILHFTCHGVIDDAGERYLQLGPNRVDHRLYSMMLETIDLGGKILFINACSSVSPYETVFSARKDLATFGWLIEKRGGGAVIGTLAPIPGPAAVEVAQQFYLNLFGENQNIGDALFNAKVKLAEEGAPYGLIYSLYGDPLLVKHITSPTIEGSPA